MKMKKTPFASKSKGARLPDDAWGGPKAAAPKMSLTSFLVASSPKPLLRLLLSLSAQQSTRPPSARKIFTKSVTSLSYSKAKYCPGSGDGSA